MDSPTPPHSTFHTMPPPPRLLASDLDGTLIPAGLGVDGEAIGRFRSAVAARDLPLAYVTGRDVDLALRGIARFGLPLPDLMVCDVGTSVYQRVARSDRFVPDAAYAEQMRIALGGARRDDLLAPLATLAGLQFQDERKQTEFKVSFWVDPAALEALREQVDERLAPLPVRPRTIWSHDPHSGRPLLDLLPPGVAKHTGLEHVRRAGGFTLDDIVFAGDSGNDLEALVSGHPAVVVANAPDAVKAEVRARAGDRGMLERIYFARRSFADGVLEGCRHFGVL